ncbi:MAG: hypothetical protein COB75_03280 [Idiomarina sp.]|nr:hypothetical protein [Idiomarinaceae bacterium]MBL4741928.1 hypothetical protein [Idiomarina sp.]PHQ77434.1 MAG: hypothetical protein COB75_03280 [Idiomarina sp.]HAD47897.1 hypothetical protein [Idiomarina sp.]
MYKVNPFPIKPDHPALLTLGMVLIVLVYIAGDLADPLAMGVLFLFIEIQNRYYAARVKDLDNRLKKFESHQENMTVRSSTKS